MGSHAHAKQPAEPDQSQARPSGDMETHATGDAEVVLAQAPYASLVRREGLDLESAPDLSPDVGPAEETSADDRTMTEKTEAVAGAVAEVAEFMAGLDALDDEIRAVLSEVMDDYELVALEVVDDESGSWEISASINPSKFTKVPRAGGKKKTAKTKPTFDFKQKRVPAAEKKKVKADAAKLSKQYGENSVHFRKQARRKARQALLKRGMLSKRFTKDGDYSDSEDESTPFNQSYGPNIRNVTKNFASKEKPEDKVDNTVSKTGLTSAIAALEGDAHTIHDLIPKESRSFGATTILTAVVSRKDGLGYRRFVFCNVDGNLAPHMRTKAESLGYHVITAPQAHAEGQMIQYLKSREGLYSLHNMGCDKDHCAECEWAMNAYLKTFDTTGKFSGKTFKNWYLPPPLIEALGRTDASTNKRDKDGMVL